MRCVGLIIDCYVEVLGTTEQDLRDRAGRFVAVEVGYRHLELLHVQNQGQDLGQYRPSHRRVVYAS